jgi:hypothetical protein
MKRRFSSLTILNFAQLIAFFAVTTWVDFVLRIVLIFRSDFRHLAGLARISAPVDLLLYFGLATLFTITAMWLFRLRLRRRDEEQAQHA